MTTDGLLAAVPPPGARLSWRAAPRRSSLALHTPRWQLRVVSRRVPFSAQHVEKLARALTAVPADERSWPTGDQLRPPPIAAEPSSDTQDLAATPIPAPSACTAAEAKLSRVAARTPVRRAAVGVSVLP